MTLSAGGQPTMRRSVVLSLSWVREVVPLAQQAERAGLDRVWTTEYQGYDAIVRAALIAASTERIGIGTGITYAFTRSPLAIAAAAADVQAASNGRFTLGLGMGTNGMRSRWYGVELDSPASRFADYVGFVKSVLRARQGFRYSGRYHKADIPAFEPTEPDLLARLPVWGSGVNATMLRVAAATCDGVALHPLTMAREYWSATIQPTIAAASRPDGKPAELAMWVLTSVADDEHLARAQARRSLAFYFSTPSYRSAAAGAGWERTVHAVAERAGRGDTLDELAPLISDDMLDELTLSGTPDQVRDRLELVEADLAARGVSEVVLQVASRGAQRADAVRGCAALIDCASRRANAG